MLNPWAPPRADLVRATFDSAHFAAVLDRLLMLAPGTRLLDLGCGDGLIAWLGGARLDAYVGVDLFPPDDLPAVRTDLRHGLGPAASEPFDIYLGTFGIASHLAPSELQALLGEIAASAAPGAIVALEGLGLWSLEWPRVWD